MPSAESYVNCTALEVSVVQNIFLMTISLTKSAQEAGDVLYLSEELQEVFETRISNKEHLGLMDVTYFCFLKPTTCMNWHCKHKCK